jgi:hypothetical protein
MDVLVVDLFMCSPVFMRTVSRVAVLRTWPRLCVDVRVRVAECSHEPAVKIFLHMIASCGCSCHYLGRGGGGAWHATAHVCCLINGTLLCSADAQAVHVGQLPPCCCVWLACPAQSRCTRQ